MKRAWLLGLGIVVAVIGIAAFATLLPIIQSRPQPRPVSVTFGVSSNNGAGGCLNVDKIPLAVLRLDGNPLPYNSSTGYTGFDNGTIITLMSGSHHVISANQTYTGLCTCAECDYPKGENVTITFSNWFQNDVSLNGSSDTLGFTVPSNGSVSFGAEYEIA